MSPNEEYYKGREQAYVKHYFLSNYLERLVHKTAGRFNHIVYVDGFSGPWQSASERYDDTSFGIALRSLRAAKASWKALDRTVSMTAVLVETAAEPFRLLQQLPAQYPDIDIKPLRGDFSSLAADIRREIPNEAFAFLFIDPKGWRIRLNDLRPLLSRPNTEVVFNFMFDFINRFATISDPKVISGLDELMPAGSWQTQLISSGAGTASATRKAALVEAFSSSLSQVGSYPYVLETPILRPLIDRTLYSLIYATRKPIGVEVFRDCQIKALREQASVRTKAKREAAIELSGQPDMFGSETQFAPNEADLWLAGEERDALAALLAEIPLFPKTVRYDALWPKVLSRHAIRKTTLGHAVGALHKDGAIVSTEWEPRKRVPSDHYNLSRAAD